MSSKDTYHVLLCCESRQDVDYFTNLLRSRGPGVSIRTRGIGSLVELRECLGDGTWELVITTEGQRDLAAANVIAVGRELGVPVLYCGVTVTAEQVDELLHAGASDVLRRGQGGRLFHVVAREIAALRARRALESLRPRYQEAMRRCELLLEAADGPIAYATDGVHLHCNSAYARVFGFEDVGDLEGVPQLDLVAPECQASFREALRRYRDQPVESITVSIAALRSDGATFPAQFVLSRTSYEGEPCMQVLVRAAPAASAPATGAGGLAALGAALAAAAGGQLLLIAVDGFNQHCRNLGVSAANGLVEELGAFVAHSVGWPQAPLRAADGVLAVHLPASDTASALADARRAVEAVAGHIHEVGSRSVSCGICVEVCPLGEGRDATVTALLDRCWSALLDTAERAQRLRAADPERVALASAGEPAAAAGAAPAGGPSVEEALRAGELRVLYQPIVSLRGDSSEYYEVQARHQPSGRAALDWLAGTNPGASSAELDQLVAQEALASLAEHRATRPETRLILPVGGGSVLDPDFADWLAATLRAAAVPPDCVVIAIAHRTASSHLKQAKLLAERLASLGCQLCVSDVHSGDNPIPELLHLRPQFARIAETLAPALADTESTNTLLKPLIESLHREQIASIMPKVEGAGVLAVLWQLGVNFIQGDYLQPAQPQMHYDFTDLA